jgi:hypothetical protein
LEPKFRVGPETLYVSIDDGETWRADSGLPSTSIQSISVIDSGIYLVTNNGIFQSSDNGITWDPTNGGVMDTTYPTTLVKAGMNLVAGTQENGAVYLSSDHGSTWVNVGKDLPMVVALASDDSDVFASTRGGIYLSTDGGLNWLDLNDTLLVNAFAVSGPLVFAGRAQPGFPVSAPSPPLGGAFRSLDLGATWSTYDIGLPSYLLYTVPCPQVYTLALHGTEVYAGADSGVYISNIDGEGWTRIDNGLPRVTAQSIYVNDSSIFVGTESQGIWERPLSQVTSIVKKTGLNLPTSFKLYQNYPNPFNPTTTIEFNLPRQTHVILDVYDALGRLVATLVDGVEAPGLHEIAFDGSRLPSGVYFYHLVTGTYSETGKALLLK